MEITQNQDALRIWKTLNLDIAYLGLAKVGQDWQQEQVCSPFSRLYYILDGEGLLYVQGQTIRLCPGQVYLIPAGLVFSHSCPDSMEQLFFHVNLLRPNGVDLFFEREQVYVCQAGQGEAERMRNLYLDASLSSAFLLRGALWTVLARFLELADIRTEHARSYSPLVEQTFHLAQHPVSAANRVKDLAAKLHVSESTLSKRFHEETGMTPGAYLDQLILTRACRLLLSGDCSIAEIADRLSFADQFYFAKYFKRLMQVTPSAYRRQMRAG